MTDKSTQDLGDGSKHNEMEDQHIYLADISVVTEDSTSRESLTRNDLGHDWSPTLPDDRQQRAEYKEQQTEYKEGNSLAISFGRILALSDSIIHHFDAKSKSELADLHLPSDILTDFVQYLEGRVLLDLRIWAKDLTFNDEFAFDHLDSIQWPSKEAAKLMIVNELRGGMTEISNILETLASYLNPPPTHELFIKSLESARSSLEYPLERLLSQKTAIKKFLMTLPTKRPLNTKLGTPHSEAGHAPNVLCFDGGGVKSYSSLLILKALMERVQSILENSQLRPAEIFDFIVGSSSGGLIAIMLGRLGMTVDETISKYIEYTEAVFRRSRWFSLQGLIRPRYSQKNLRKAARLTVGKFDPFSSAEGWRRNIFSTPNSPSKTGIVAWDSKNNCPYMFRTYDCFGNNQNMSEPLNPGPADSHQIWQIARATAAAPSYFNPMQLEDRVFLDGGISTNNPTQEAVRDLEFLYNGILNDACVVSVGSGLASKHASPKHPSKIPWIRSIGAILATTRQIVTQTESTHRTVSDFLGHAHVSYFRLNVEEIGDTRIDNWRLLEHISKRTNQHLSTDATRDTLDRCAKVLIQRFRTQSLGNEQSFNDSNVAKQQKEIWSGPDSSLRTRRRENYKIGFIMRGPPGVTNFIGRTQEMDALNDFFGHEDCRRRTCEVVGLGGVGKTQLALEFARRNRDRFDCIFWLDASSEIKLRHSIAGIAPLIRLAQEPSKMLRPDEREAFQLAVEQVKNWLSKPDNQSWLLIYDNVDHADDITCYFPSVDHGSILITTRRLDLRLGTQLKVEIPDNLASTEMITREIGEALEGSSDTQELLKTLGGLPLAIAQACAFMKVMNISISNYLDLYREQWTGLMKEAATSGNGIAATWTVSYAAMNEDSVSMLQLFACLDPAELWFELFEPAALKLASVDKDGLEWFYRVAGTKLAFLKAIRPLLNYSLISSHRNSSVYSVHPVLHEWCWHEHVRTSRTDLTTLAVIIVGLAIPIGDDLVTRDIKQPRFLPHADHCLRRSNAIDHSLGAIGETLKPLYLEALDSLGQLYFSQRKLVKAEEIYVALYTWKVNLLGKEDQSTMNTMQSLADLYSAQGRLNEAEHLFIQALAWQAARFGQQHISFLDTRRRLALCYHQQRRLKESADMYRQILHEHEATIGPNHLSTLRTASGLGHLLFDQGVLEESESLFRWALVGFESILEPDHPLILDTMRMIARLLHRKGKIEEAISVEGQALAGYERVVGLQHGISVEQPD